jgi:hypothetical protein
MGAARPLFFVEEAGKLTYCSWLVFQFASLI